MLLLGESFRVAVDEDAATKMRKHLLEADRDHISECTHLMHDFHQALVGVALLKKLDHQCILVDATGVVPEQLSVSLADRSECFEICHGHGLATALVVSNGHDEAGRASDLIDRVFRVNVAEEDVFCCAVRCDRAVWSQIFDLQAMLVVDEPGREENMIRHQFITFLKEVQLTKGADKQSLGDSTLQTSVNVETLTKGVLDDFV